MRYYVIMYNGYGDGDRVLGVTSIKDLAEDYVSKYNQDKIEEAHIEEFEDMYEMDYSNPVYRICYNRKQFVKMEQIPMHNYQAREIIRTGTFYTICRHANSEEWEMIMFAPDPAIALKNAMEYADTIKFDEETD